MRAATQTMALQGRGVRARADKRMFDAIGFAAGVAFAILIAAGAHYASNSGIIEASAPGIANPFDFPFAD